MDWLRRLYAMLVAWYRPAEPTPLPQRSADVSAGKPRKRRTKLVEKRPTYTPVRVDSGATLKTTSRRQILLAQDGELVPSVEYHGTEYHVDLSKAEAWRGYPFTYGVLRLEQDPELHPLLARGLANRPGVYMDLLNTPQVEAVVEEQVAAVCATPFRLEPAEVPDWVPAERRAYHEEARDRQLEFASRVWWEWRRPERETGFHTMVADILRTCPVSGFYLGELVVRPVRWRLGGDPVPRVYWLPLPLEWRAPWSVCEWIWQDDREVGAVLTNLQQQNSDGQIGDYRVVLPADKYVHVAARQVGGNPEGRSHLRSVHESVQMLRDAMEIEALAIEVNGVGTIVVQEPETGWGAGQRDQLKAHLENYTARHVPWLILPNGSDARILSPSASIHEMGGPITRGERAVMMGLGAEGRLVGVQKHGSFAARESASEDAWRPYTHVATEYVARPLQQLLGRVIRHNFPEYCAASPEEPDAIYAPTVEVGTVEKRSTSQTVDDMVRALPLLGTPFESKARDLLRD